MFQNSWNMSDIQTHCCILHKKGFQTKKRFVKGPRWHQVMNFAGWTHVIVYASVQLVILCDFVVLYFLCGLFGPTFNVYMCPMMPQGTLSGNW